MKWLVTGGCGFIGVNLVHNLLKDKGNQVVVLDNLSVGTRDELRAVCDFESKTRRATLIVADILDEQAVMSAVEGMDIIVHLAANTGVGQSVEDPRTDCVTNVLGTLNVLEAARVNQTKRVIFASSGAPIGECEPPIHEELAAHPVSPYGASKLAGEGYCSAYYQSFGIHTTALRFGNVYGPYSRHKSSVVAKFIGNAIAGRSLEIYGDGNQTRDFIFVDDLVGAIFKASAASGIGGEVFQVATQRETSVNELVEALENVLQRKYPGLGVATSYIEPRSGDVRRNFSDTSKAKAMLGWQARYSLDEGLSATIDWFLTKSDPSSVQLSTE